VGWIGLIHRPSDILKPISLDITYSSHSKSDLPQTEREELPIKTTEFGGFLPAQGQFVSLRLIEHVYQNSCSLLGPDNTEYRLPSKACGFMRRWRDNGIRTDDRRTHVPE
jgi:hypothetical protein